MSQSSLQTLKSEFEKTESHYPPEEKTIILEQPQFTPKTVVMYHGFIAGPWQFTELADRLYKSGYNVIVPRMAGHDFREEDGKTFFYELPQLGQKEIYLDCAEALFQPLIDSGYEPHIVGFSAGGLLGIHLAEKYPVKSLILISPFFGMQNHKWSLGFAKALSVLPFIRKKITNRPLNYQSQRSLDSDKADVLKISLGNLLELISLRSSQYKKASVLKLPLLMLLSECDTTIQLPKAKAFFDQLSAPIRRIKIFPKHRKIPHSMMSPYQNKNKQSLTEVLDLIEKFIINLR